MNRDERKNQLENKIENVSSAIKNQLVDYKGKGKNLLVIGGIIVAGYALSRILISDDEEEPVNSFKSSIEKKPSLIANAFSGIASTLVLSVLKSKLQEYLEQSKAKNEE